MRQTYVTSEIVLMIVKIMTIAPADLQDSLIRKIVHETRLIIAHGSVERTASKIEVMNLLIVLRELGQKYLLDERSILHVFDVDTSNGAFVFSRNFDYFQLVFLLSYVGGVAQHSLLIRAAIEHSTKRFNDSDWAQSAECVFILLDVMTCPYVLREDKIKLAKTVLRHVSDVGVTARAESLIAAIGDKPWFFGWDKQTDLALVLKKKELRTPY